MVNFQAALSGIGKVVNSLWPILHTSDDMKRVFGEKPIVSLEDLEILKMSWLGQSGRMKGLLV